MSKLTRKEWARKLGTDPTIIHRRSKTMRKAIRCVRQDDGFTATVYGCHEAVRLTGLPHHVIYNYLTRSRRQCGVRGWEFNYIPKQR